MRVLRHHEDERYRRTILRGTEVKLQASVEIDGRNLELLGYIDRIEESDEGLLIVDYKSFTSSIMPSGRTFPGSSREEWPKTLKSVQLPFYVLLYLLNHPEATVDRVDSELMLLGSEPIREARLFDGASELPKDRLFDAYSDAILALIREILDPEIDFVPLEDVKKGCAGCEFQVMCGRQWVKGWKRT
jgi:hypothetical protein